MWRLSFGIHTHLLLLLLSLFLWIDQMLFRSLIFHFFPRLSRRELSGSIERMERERNPSGSSDGREHEN
jgi:hypothetical protein